MSINIIPSAARGRLTRFNAELQSAMDALAPIETQINNYINEAALLSVAYHSHKNYLRDGHLPLLRKKRDLYECLIERNTSHMSYINQYLYDAPYFDSAYIDKTILGLRGLIMLAEVAGLGTESLEQMLNRWIDRRSRLQDFVSATNDIYSDVEAAINAVDVQLARLIFASYCTDTRTFTIFSAREVTEKMEWMRSVGLLDIYNELFVTSDVDARRALFAELFTLLYNSADSELTNAILNIIEENMTFEDRMAMIYNGDLNGLHGRFGGGQRGPYHLFDDGDEDFVLFMIDLLGTTCEDTIADFLNMFWEIGCSYIAMANTIFVEFANRPNEFEQIFGFPMYTVDGCGVRINFEFLSIHLYNNFGCDGRGTSARQRAELFPVYLENRGIIASITYENHSVDGIAEAFNDALQNGNQIILRQSPTILHRLEDNVARDGSNPIVDLPGRHAVTVTGITEEGNILVSSWGEEFVLMPSDYNLESDTLDFEVISFE